MNSEDSNIEAGTLATDGVHMQGYGMDMHTPAHC